MLIELKMKRTQASKHVRTLAKIERAHGVGFLFSMYETFSEKFYQTEAFNKYGAFREQIAQVYNDQDTNWKQFVQEEKTFLL